MRVRAPPQDGDVQRSRIKEAILRIGKCFKIELQQRPVPSDEEVAALVGQRLTVLLEARFRGYDGVQRERVQRFLPLARNLCDEEDGAALVAMLLEASYQESLNRPPPGPGAQGSGGQKSRGGDGRSSRTGQKRRSRRPRRRSPR